MTLLLHLAQQEAPSQACDPRSLDAVLITHAHIDHTGYLPRLVRQGFRGPVFCSRGTADLLKILLPDAGRLQQEEADYRNRHQPTKHKPALLLDTERDAFATVEFLRPVANTGKAVAVNGCLFAVEWSASTVSLRMQTGRRLFTGSKEWNHLRVVFS